MQYGRITLTQFIIEEQRHHAHATGEFSGLLSDVGTACKVISNAVARGGLGLAPGEEQKPLDVVSNEVMQSANGWSGHLAGMVSEENEALCPIPGKHPRGKYLLLFDPLDGSSNFDVNLSVGTIFSILRSPRPGKAAKPDDFLQPGTEQVCAGFALYGPSTLLVLTTGHGVNGFTLDRDIGEFILTHPTMRIPEDTSVFAIDAANERFWEPPVKRYVEECLDGKTGPRAKDFNMRWVASLVAETYRILVRGGVFMYPKDNRHPDQPGRLHLLTQANPVSFIVEQAGGAATTGHHRLMAVQPSELHQRVPLIFGSKHEVDRISSYHADYASGLEPAGFDSPLFGTRSLFRTQ